MARSTIFKPDPEQLPSTPAAPRGDVAVLDPAVETSLRTARAIEKTASGEELTTAEDEHLRTRWARGRMDGPSIDARRERIDYARWLRQESAKSTTIAGLQAQAGSGAERQAAAAKLAQTIERQAEELPDLERKIRELDLARAGLARDVTEARKEVAAREAAVTALTAERLLPADVSEELKALRRTLREPIRVANELRSRITSIETLSAYDPAVDYAKAVVESYCRGAGLTDIVFLLTEPARPHQANIRIFDAAAWADHVASLQTEADGLREQLAAIPDPTTMIACQEAALLNFWVPE